MSESSQADSSSAQASASPEDDWSSVKDPNERRKIQNRIAQRKFRKSSVPHIAVKRALIEGQERRFGSNERMQIAMPRTSVEQVAPTLRQTPKRLTRERRACLGEASHSGTSLQLAAPRSRTRVRLQYMLRRHEPEVVRGKRVVWRG